MDLTAPTDAPGPVRTHRVPGPPPMQLDLPLTWRPLPDAPGPGVLTAFGDDRSLSPAVETNIVLTTTPPLEDPSLARWQQAIRAEQLAALPDAQVIEDRLDTDARATWYRALLMTDPSGSTLLVRHWSRVVAGAGVTLSLTTAPGVDAEHAPLLDAIAGSWRTESADAAH